jgi:hypothetical protein
MFDQRGTKARESYPESAAGSEGSCVERRLSGNAEVLLKSADVRRAEARQIARADSAIQRTSRTASVWQGSTQLCVAAKLGEYRRYRLGLDTFGEHVE